MAAVRFAGGDAGDVALVFDRLVNRWERSKKWGQADIRDAYAAGIRLNN